MSDKNFNKLQRIQNRAAPVAQLREAVEAAAFGRRRGRLATSVKKKFLTPHRLTIQSRRHDQ